MSELLNAYWPMILVAVAIGLIVGLVVFRRPKQRVTLSKAETPVRPHMAAVSDERQPPSPAPAAAPVSAPAPAPAPAPVAARDDSDGGGEGEDVGDEMAAAASDVIGEFVGAPVHSNLPGSHGVPDDLQRMKGVGPKLAGLLQGRGLTRFEQIAALSPDEVTALDADLGAFKGRLTRDRVVEQAAYLARGDQAGYEAAFGKL
jgi:predicted flap endonuclease-1-like 5' DNA nuclease